MAIECFCNYASNDDFYRKKIGVVDKCKALLSNEATVRALWLEVILVKHTPGNLAEVYYID